MKDINDYSIHDYGYILKAPKIIATIKLCGGALTFNITDNIQYEIPTEEQRENLKKTFGIEIELVNDD